MNLLPKHSKSVSVFANNDAKGVARLLLETLCDTSNSSQDVTSQSSMQILGNAEPPHDRRGRLIPTGTPTGTVSNLVPTGLEAMQG